MCLFAESVLTLTSVTEVTATTDKEVWTKLNKEEEKVVG